MRALSFVSGAYLVALPATERTASAPRAATCVGQFVFAHKLIRIRPTRGDVRRGSQSVCFGVCLKGGSDAAMMLYGALSI